jgi:hypothetical protein
MYEENIDETCTALTYDTTQIIADYLRTRAGAPISERLRRRACEIRNTLQDIKRTEERMTVETRIQELGGLFQRLREFTQIRDWQHAEQQWDKLMLQLCHGFQARRNIIAFDDFQRACRDHADARSLHQRYIHQGRLPLITATELAVLVACSPLAAGWRTTLPTRCPILPPTFTKPIIITSPAPEFCESRMDDQGE